MPTTYAAAVSLADSEYLDNNPHGWVPGFDTNPAKFLQDVVQPYADAGIRLMLHNAFGRGGKSRTFSKRYDDQPASVTVVECVPFEPGEHFFALSDFIRSPGMDGTFLYIGAPEIHLDPTLAGAVSRLTQFSHYFPGCIPIYDNVGDIDSSELCAGSALFAAHDAMALVPFKSPVPWGIEPNRALKNSNGPDVHFMPDFTYGTPETWSVPTRIDIHDVHSTPIVAIRGDDYKTPDERLAVAREWGPRVEPYNGIVVVHRVSVEQMQELTK